MSDQMPRDLAESIALIERLLVSARMGLRSAPVPIDEIPDALKQLATSANALAKDVAEMSDVTGLLAKGKLEIEAPPRTNMFAGNIKQLHANLLHLTWQTQQVAEGDYTQSVNFLGDFSVAFNQMISQLQERMTLLKHDALTDALTGIPNRRQLSIEAERNWPLYRRLELPVSVMMIDIDKFKNYNDTYGHPQGDICLRDVACCIRRTMGRKTDVVARYGGEEFLVLLPNADENAAKRSAERIRKSIELLIIPNRDGGSATQVTISIGVSTGVPTSKCTFEQLVLSADEALYRAKNEGRNRIVLNALSDTDET